MSLCVFGTPLDALDKLRINLNNAIKIITPQTFIKRLRVFNLISDKENEILQQNMTQIQVNQINAEISEFITHKLYNDESSVYYERFKYFLGYYEDLRYMYLIWESLCKTFLSLVSSYCIIFFVLLLQISITTDLGCPALSIKEYTDPDTFRYMHIEATAMIIIILYTI